MFPSNTQALVVVESSKNPAATTLEDFDDKSGDSEDLESICSSYVNACGYFILFV